MAKVQIKSEKITLWRENYRFMEQFDSILPSRSFGHVRFQSFSFSNSFIRLPVILFLYHLQNLVGKASHSLDSWVTVLLVYVMKGDDRNLIGLADLFY